MEATCDDVERDAGGEGEEEGEVREATSSATPEPPAAAAVVTAAATAGAVRIDMEDHIGKLLAQPRDSRFSMKR